MRRSPPDVGRNLKRYGAEGIQGLSDMPHPGAPRRITAEYESQLVEVVRRRPRSLGLPHSMWTLERLAEHMAEQTGICGSIANIVLSRPHWYADASPLSWPLRPERGRERILGETPPDPRGGSAPAPLRACIMWAFFGDTTPGHSIVSITLDVYSHVTPGLQEARRL